MNYKEINELKKILPPHIEYNSWTEEQKQLDKELSCREMINSCLIYEMAFLDSDYSEEYFKELGESKVLELYNEQLEHFDKCILIENVYENSEGVTYNNLIEPNENGFIIGEIVEEPHYKIINDTNETYFSIKLKNEYNNCFEVALSFNVNNDYSEYYIGRNIGIKVEKTNVGIYKIVEVDFLKNENKEIEM